MRFLERKIFYALINFVKNSGQTTTLVSGNCDYLVWYAKHKPSVKFRRLFYSKAEGTGFASRYDSIELQSGKRVLASSVQNEAERKSGRLFALQPAISAGFNSGTTINFDLNGKTYHPGMTRQWKYTYVGMTRLAKANRLVGLGRMIYYPRYLDDFPAYAIGNNWADTQDRLSKDYVVQTVPLVIERCMLMTTDPGDLVFDPTCGSGTTAVSAEKWGRRWITCDTSRVAVTLAKQRIVTTSFDYFTLRYPHEGLKGGFNYKTVPHVMLKYIANNPEVDEIWERMHPAIEVALAELNKAAGQSMQEWEVQCDFPADWPEAASKPFDAFHSARLAMKKQMDFSIANHADQETLYDQPEVDKKKLRITGPFSVEAVPFPTVLALDEAQQPIEADVTFARSGESMRQHSWRDELLKTGIRGKGGQMLKFAELETIPGTKYLHALGTLADSGERVVVSFGPEHAALEQRQVQLALNEAENLRPKAKMIVFCAFTFDPEAAKDIDETNWPGVTLLKAQMNTDLLTEDLKKARSSNQSFWLMGQPDVEVHKLDDGRYQVEVHGFDYFNTKSGELESGGKGKIAVWLLDADYDERSLFPKQVFFPLAGKKDGWNKLKKTIRAELDESLLDNFHGTVSLPFEAGDNRKVAVKIVDDRGIESLKVVSLD